LSLLRLLLFESPLDLTSSWVAQPAVTRAAKQTEHKIVDRCLLGMSFSKNLRFVS
jgi:hypothetical protein